MTNPSLHPPARSGEDTITISRAVLFAAYLAVREAWLLLDTQESPLGYAADEARRRLRRAFAAMESPAWEEMERSGMLPPSFPDRARARGEFIVWRRERANEIANAEFDHLVAAPAASVGEPAERPMDIGPGSASDKAKALLQLEALFGVYPMATGFSHLAGLVIRDAVKGKSPSVSGSVRDETLGRIGKLSREDAAQFDTTILAGCVPHSPSSARVDDAPHAHEFDTELPSIDGCRYKGCDCGATLCLSERASSARVSEDAPGDEKRRGPDDVLALREHAGERFADEDAFECIRKDRIWRVLDELEAGRAELTTLRAQLAALDRQNTRLDEGLDEKQSECDDLCDQLTALRADRDRLQAKADAYDRINTPELYDFAAAVTNEALHQREKWGVEGDGGKTDADWFWLIGYLAGKALHNPPKPDMSAIDAQLHRIITVAAAATNWHAATMGVYAKMRPGIESPASPSSSPSTATLEKARNPAG